MIIEILSAAGASDYIDEVRTKVIADSVEKYIRHLQKISGTQIQRQAMSVKDDVEESIFMIRGGNS